MSIEDCKQGITELLANTKVRTKTTEKLQKRIQDMLEVNAKYGGLDGNTNPQHILDDFTEAMKIERIKQRNNTIRNAKVVNDLFVKIKTNEKDPKHYFRALMDEIEGGNQYKNSIYANSEHMADKTVGGFMNDLKRKNLLDVFRKADEGLSNDIIVEIRLAGGSKKDVPTNNKDAKAIASIVYTHRENARILHNAYGGNIGKLEGYEGRTRYSKSKLDKYGEENYIKWAKENYDWEKIEKTKGRVINDQDAYISEVFKLNTDSIKRIDSNNDYIPTNGGQVGSRFNKGRSIFFKTGKWEEHNNMFGETDTLTNTFEQLLSISMATGAMRKAGADPTGNIKRIMGMLEEQTGGKFTAKQVREVDFATEVITGKAFAVIDQKLKITEDVIKNTTATAQLGSAAITAGFTDTVGSAMVYKRLGMSYTRGIKNAIVGTLKGLTKGQRKRIDELVDITFQSDPHTLGNRFEAVDSGGLGGNYLNKYFRLTLMSQVTDGAKIQHTEAFMRILARKRKTNWKNLEGDFKTVLKNYDIGQKDWDVIRKYGLVEFKGNDVISPKVLERMTDTDIKSVFKVSNTGDILRARDGIVAKLNNFLFDLKDTSSLTPNLKTRASMTLKQTQGTAGSFGVNIGGQYLSSPLAFKQRVWGADFVPIRGEKFDKLNLIQKGGVLLAIAVISGFTVLNTKEAIVNIQRKALGLKPHDRYNLFDKHGELDPKVLIKSLGTGGGFGIWGDMFIKFAENADDFSNVGSVIPAVGTVEPIIRLMKKLATGNTKNIDRDVNKVIKGITPSTLYSKEATNSAVVLGLDWLFKNNLKGNIERNRRKYAK